MRAKAVRIHGAYDLRLDTFELPPLGERELLARVLSDSLCASSYKCAVQGVKHKRVPADIAEHPAILGHELCAEIVALGAQVDKKYRVGQRFAMQTAALPNTADSAGYSFEFCGGDATYMIVPERYLAADALLPYTGEGFYPASLAEPYSCVINAIRGNFHLDETGAGLRMGIVEGGSMLLLSGVGPMGLAALDYILHCDRRPGRLVVTGRNTDKLARVRRLFPEADAKKQGVELHYLYTGGVASLSEALLAPTGGRGYNDVFVFAPSAELVEAADDVLAGDGCLNFFAGPTDTGFKASVNFYDVHYNASHFCGSSGGSTQDMLEALEMMRDRKLTPAMLVTHIGGLDCAAEATLHLPELPGGKKLIYPGIRLPLTALEDLERLGAENPLLAGLSAICRAHGGLWSPEAERYLLENASPA